MAAVPVIYSLARSAERETVQLAGLRYCRCASIAEMIRPNLLSPTKIRGRRSIQGHFLDRSIRSSLRKEDLPRPKIAGSIGGKTGGWLAVLSRSGYHAGVQGSRGNITLQVSEVKPKLQLSLFGDFRASLRDVDVTPTRNSAVRVLLLLSLGDSTREARPRICELLWPDADPKRARENLRQALFYLRRQFDEIGFEGLSISRTHVALDRSSVSVDSHLLLTEIVEQGRVPQKLLQSPEFLDTYLASIVEKSDSFGDWLAERRSDFRRNLHDALRQLLERPDPSVEERRQCAVLLLALDQGDEVACRVLMRLSVAYGDTVEALRRYKALWTYMTEEFDVEPSEQTQSLAVAIKLGKAGAELNSKMMGPEETLRLLPDTGSEISGSATVKESQSSHETDGTGYEHLDSADFDERQWSQSKDPANSQSVFTRYTTPAGVPVLAVIPFAAVGPEPVPDYVSLMIADDIVCKLASIREYAIIATNTTRKYVNTSVDVPQLRNELSVDYVLEGTLLKNGERYNFSMQLFDTANLRIVWAGKRQTTLDEVLNFQATLASEITNALIPSVRTTELNWSNHIPVENLSAYHLYLSGLERMFGLKPDRFNSALGLLENAVRKDETFSLAHAAIADWYSLYLGQGWSENPMADVQKMLFAAKCAERYNFNDGRALSFLAHNKTVYDHDHDNALRLIDSALKKSPNETGTLLWTGPTLAYSGLAKEAVENTEKAIMLSPQDPHLFRYQHFCSIAHMLSGNYDKAIDYGLQSLQANPAYTSNLKATAASLVAVGRTDEARELAASIKKYEPNFSLRNLAKRLPIRNPKICNEIIGLLGAAGLS